MIEIEKLPKAEKGRYLLGMGLIFLIYNLLQKEKRAICSLKLPVDIQGFILEYMQQVMAEDATHPPISFGLNTIAARAKSK